MSNSPELFSGNIPGQFSELLMDNDDECELPFKEEMIEEFMQELYKEISCPSACLNNPTKVSPDYSFPAPDKLSATRNPSLVVDIGKNGSCGAAVSGLESSVMAGIEFVGHAGKIVGGQLRLSENGIVLGEGGCTEVDGEIMDGCDGVEFDDEWLERVLSWGAVDEFDVGPTAK